MKSLPFLVAMLLLGGIQPIAAQRYAAADAVANRTPFAEREDAETVRQEANAAYRAQRYADAAALYDRLAAMPGARSRAVAHYQAASAYALAGQADPAFERLLLAMRAGFRYPSYVAADSDLRSLHSDPRWHPLIGAAERNLIAYRERHADPERAALVTADLRNLGEALAAAAQAPDSAARVAALREHYLDPASPGLIDFVFSRTDGVGALTRFATVWYPRYFASLPGLADRIAREEPRIRAAFRRLKALYPEAHFPPVYIVVGHFRSGGMLTESGLLIGVDVFGVSDDTPVDEFAPSRVPIIHPFEQIVGVVAHELIHAQQLPGGARSLLASSLLEGGADFLAELLLGEPPTGHHHAWGQANEATVWARFSREMHELDTSAWIANNHTATDDWPAALGYFVGYQIARAYYERSADERRAVRSLILLDDPETILRESGYAERFRDPR